MNSMKRQKDRTLKDEPSSLADVQYATGEEQRNNQEGTKRLSQMEMTPSCGWDVPGGESKV